MRCGCFLRYVAGCLVALMLPLALASGGVQGATYYVDGNCPTSGNGSTLVCGPNGPKTRVEDGIGLLSGPGDVLEIRGIHSPHDGETGTFDGRYFGNQFGIRDLNGGSGNPIIIQPHQYTGLGTGETVFLDGTRPPSSGWTKCSNCGTGQGVCGDVPASGCDETWYASDSSTPSGFQDARASMVMGAQNDDGTPTYRVRRASDLSNNHSNFLASRCDVDTWKACNDSLDCPNGQSCSAIGQEIDSYSPQGQGVTDGLVGNHILVRWGTTLPSTPYIFYDQAGMGFFVDNSSYITMRGFNIRCHRRQGVALSQTASNIVVSDNRVFYNLDKYSSGSDYGLTVDAGSPVTISFNEIAYTGSEGIHSQCKSDGSATIIKIQNNWIHDLGAQNVGGWGVKGTPRGSILADNHSSAAIGNYAGSVYENNFMANLKIQTDENDNTISAGNRGIVLEKNANNWIIRNNVVYNLTAECIKLDALSQQGTSGNEIYNNLLIGCGTRPATSGDGPGIFVQVGASSSASNNKIYNNTFVNNNNGAIFLENNGGQVNGNIIRNNIMYDSGSKRLVNWPAGGIFQNNIVYSQGSGTIVSFNQSSWSCALTNPNADYDGDGNSGDQNQCLDPRFRSEATKDFHLNSDSPAIDAGTSTGMPVGRTTSIFHTIAGGKGFPQYDDGLARGGTAWDVGAAEFGSSGGGSISADLTLSDPSPTAGGAVGVTLTTSSTVVQLPGPLSFLESDGSSTVIPLSGAVPGNLFTGSFLVDSSVADGAGTFFLPPDNLVDSLGNIGNAILKGAGTIIDKTPPANIQNLRFENSSTP